jgi:hypothetical protein
MNISFRKDQIKNFFVSNFQLTGESDHGSLPYLSENDAQLMFARTAA